MISIILAIIISFLATYLITPKFIVFLEKAGIVGIDIQKKNKPKIAEMGGPVVLIGFLAGIFLFVWTKVFLYGSIENLIGIFAAISTILIITLIGVFDDLTCLFKRKNKFKRIGLKQWQKPLLVLPAAIPLMAIMAGDSTIVLPFVGTVNFGILYPLVLIPIGIVGASNAMNMLAGLNGLETGLGTILLSSLGLYAYLHNEIAAAVIALSLAFALLAFLKFNWYPAKIMPGDSLVYIIGVTVAVVAIIGNMEKFALLAFTPWILEFLLKTRSRFKAQNFGILQNDGTLKAPYLGIYSITHIVMKIGRFKEWQVVSIIVAAESILCAFLLWFYLV